MARPKPSQTYITALWEQMRRELWTLHQQMDELERLRYFEDKIALSEDEVRTGIEIRVGLTAELVENVKAALTTNVPRVKITTYQTSDKAHQNVSKREKFWNHVVNWTNQQFPTLHEAADALIGLGLGILKAAYTPYEGDFIRNEGEKAGDYLKRVKALKQAEGPPISIIDIHPMTFFFRKGAKNQVTECIEHSYKSKYEIYDQYNLNDDIVQPLPKGKKQLSRIGGNDALYNLSGIMSTAGQPNSVIRMLPAGMDTSTLVLVTEYWSKDWYVVLVNGNEVYSEEKPSVRYFIGTGRTSSSKDPNKVGISVAEPLRHNEPALNRAFTRMFESLELIVKQRLTVEFPEGSTDGTVIDETGNITTRTFSFKPDEADSLPAGARVVNPFDGAQNAYLALPAINQLMQITGQHGVNPIFKGFSPGAAGSGYRDNSLYSMAKSQFQYLIDSYSNMLTALFIWLEWLVVEHIKEEIWVGEFSLSPKDIEGFPVSLRVEIDPSLPQNQIAQGDFMDHMHAQGYITSNRVREEGLGIEAPEEEEFKRDLEDMKQELKPMLFADVIQTVLGRNPNQAAQSTGLVGPDGQTPISSSTTGGIGGTGGNAPIGRQAGRAIGGMMTGGLPKAPDIQPGSTIPTPVGANR